MKRIVSCSEMKALDNRTISEKGIPSCVLMERAALKTAEVLEEEFHKRNQSEKILVVCGSGNNGGDGIAIARILHLHGFCAEIYLAGAQEHMTEETRRQLQIAENYQVRMVNNPEWDEYTTIVDAIFGVGLARPIEGRYAELIRQMNSAKAWKAAVDIPSGVAGDTGKELGIAFWADVTVTFAYRKRGLCFYPGRMYAGRIVVADIGIYADEEEDCRVWHLETADLSSFPERIPYGNKGTFGKVLVVAGSTGMCGAAFLSAAAAFAGGAGMVKIQTVEENRVPLQTLLPEAMLSCVFSEAENQKSLDWCDVVVIGPGLGVCGESRERAQWFLCHASSAGKRIILDADALNLMSLHPEWKSYLNERVILTPHLGEMGRLCNKRIGEIQECILETALDFSKETGAVCVLKDACTVVADSEGRAYLNLNGNCGMATAGSGDVLSGVLAAVCCMFLAAPEDAPDYGMQAALGVYLHAAAGDEAAEKTGVQGMTARDIVRMLVQVCKKCGNASERADHLRRV